MGWCGLDGRRRGWLVRFMCGICVKMWGIEDKEEFREVGGSILLTGREAKEG